MFLPLAIPLPSSAKSRIGMCIVRKAPRILFGFVLLVVLIGYFDPGAIAAKLTDLNPVFVTATASLILIATFIGAYNTYLLVNLENGLAFSIFLPLYWLAWAVGLVFPGQVGDIATLSAVMKRRGLNITQTLGRSLVDKLISFVLMLGFGCWGIISLPGVSFESCWPLTALPLVVALLLYWQRHLIERVLKRRCHRILEFLQLTLRETMQVARCHPGRAAANMVMTSIKIGLIGGAYWCMFQALGHTEVALWRVIPLVAASSLVAYLPISFNGIGTVEITGVALFSTLGIAEPTVLSAYLILRVLVLALAWLPVGLWLIAGGQPHR